MKKVSEMAKPMMEDLRKRKIRQMKK